MAGLNRVLSGQVNRGATDPFSAHLGPCFGLRTWRNFSKMAIYETRVLSDFAKTMTGLTPVTRLNFARESPLRTLFVQCQSDWALTVARMHRASQPCQDFKEFFVAIWPASQLQLQRLAFCSIRAQFCVTIPLIIAKSDTLSYSY